MYVDSCAGAVPRAWTPDVQVGGALQAWGKPRRPGSLRDPTPVTGARKAGSGLAPQGPEWPPAGQAPGSVGRVIAQSLLGRN